MGEEKGLEVKVNFIDKGNYFELFVIFELNHKI